LAEIKTTVWKIEDHTKAKHEILKRYLGAWFPILSTYSGRIIYLDGFAGPGVYEGGEDGSPVIALQTAVEHKLVPRFKEIIFFFIEKNKDRAEMLNSVLKKKFPNLPKNIKYHVVGDVEFASTFQSVLDSLEQQGSKIAPTFAFLDPFGYSDIPMSLIDRLLKYDKCEVFVTYMAGFIRRFLEGGKDSALNECFGTTKWTVCTTITDPTAKLNCIVNVYEEQLRNAGAKYVRSFGMIGEHNQIVYYLIYATKSIKGLEVMKEAMLKVDKSGSYKFSDITGNKQTSLGDFQDELSWVPTAGDSILKNFKGKTVPIEEIYEYVIADTPFPKRAAPLTTLEKASPSKIIVKRPTGSTRGFVEGTTITFSA
jgi:three-Cys-motif partner protein